jgi:tRNA/rRNA methyltransferase
MNMKPSIILVSPQGDGNIGAVARAMKNFGYSDLRLINPGSYLTSHAFIWAVNAKDILHNAKVYTNINDATSDLSATFAFTRRLGKMRQSSILLDEARGLVDARSSSSPTGLIFGREDAGLTSDEVKLADFVVTIPTSDDQPSLNLAQAVLLACYEISKPTMMETISTHSSKISPPMQFVDRAERKKTLAGLGQVLSALGYSNFEGKQLKSKILSQLETIFGRSGLTRSDVGLFDGLIARITEKIYGNREK